MIKKQLIIFLAIFLSAALYGHPVDKVNAAYWKKVLIPAEAKGNVSVTLEFFLPFECKGFILCDGKGDALKTRLMQQEGSRVRIFFNTGAAGETWLAFIKDAVGHNEALPNTSGLLHTVKKPKEKIGDVDSVDSFMKLWNNAEFQGSGFEERVFCGYNPFGNSNDTLNSHEGKMKIEKSGGYRFYSASTDASFLLIDGKPVVSWPGRHDPWKGANNEIFGDVTLEKGLHNFRYLHANTGDWMCAVAAYMLPGEKKNCVIPKEAFTEVYRASAGQLEDRDGKPVAEFSWDNRLMSFFDAFCMHDVEFNAALPAGLDVKKVKWDFGDGTSGEGAKVAHIYFKRLTYDVTMTAELAGGKQFKEKQEAQVNFRFGQNENDDNLTNEMMKRAVLQESTVGIPAEGYDAIMAAMLFYRQKKEAESFYQKSSLMKKSSASELLYDFLDKLVTAPMLESENYRGALDTWEVFVQKAQEPLKSRALLKKAEILVMPLGETQKGLEVLNEIKNASLSDQEKKSFMIAQADAVLRKEGLNAAYYILNSVKSGNVSAKNPKERLERENSINSKLFLIEQHIGSGKYQEALDIAAALEFEKPSIRLYPPLAFLKGRALSKLGRNVMAGAVLENALLLDMDDDTEAKVRIELAWIYVARKEYLKAKQQISTIRKRSQGSLEEIEASKLLDMINRNLSEGVK